MISWLNEHFGRFPDEAALIRRMAQTVGSAFIATMTLVIFNTATQAPLFTTGFIVRTVVLVVQIEGIFGMRWLARDGPLRNKEVVRSGGERKDDRANRTAGGN